MRTHREEIEIAECIIREAREHYENSEYGEADSDMNSYYEDIEQLNLKKEEKDLYRSRLDFILYIDQF